MIPVQNHYNIGVFSLLNLHTTQFIVVYIPFLFIDVYQHTARINLLIFIKKRKLQIVFFLFNIHIFLLFIVFLSYIMFLFVEFVECKEYN